jgi:hypothetical protein
VRGGTECPERTPQSPGSVAEALELEHAALAIYRQEVSQLQELPRAGASFQAGLVDDQALLAELFSMLARPDFVRLSLTLPGHPNLGPEICDARKLATVTCGVITMSGRFSQRL